MKINFISKKKTQEYIIREVNKVYELQGEPVSRKHIEVIIAQMFSRVRITNGADMCYTTGDVISTLEFEEENARVEREGGIVGTAEKIILGISEISYTRKSFLSAASFQYTHKVLINSAIRGVEDELKGLKENVILGRLIPAGTGFVGSKKHEKAKEIEDATLQKFYSEQNYED